MKPKVVSLILLLSLTALILHVRGRGDRVVSGRDLDDLPMQIGGLEGTDEVIGKDVLQVLGDGHFLSRMYSLKGTAAAEPPVDLLIAFYPTQRSGQSIHSPQNCLPGAGWTFERNGDLTFVDTDQQSHHVAEYLVSNGGTQMEVLYWYRSRGRDIAGDYAAKAFLMLQAVRDGRTDGGLIRIMTPVPQGETQEQARLRLTTFAKSLSPLLPAFLPS